MAVHGIVQSNQNIVQHRQVLEQADVLEGAGYSRLVNLDSVHPGGVLGVQKNGPPRGVVYLGEKIEHRRLSRPVRADQRGNLGAADSDIEVVHCCQSAEVNAQVARLQNGDLVHIPFGHEVLAWHGDQLAHLLFSPFLATPSWIPARLISPSIMRVREKS